MSFYIFLLFLFFQNSNSAFVCNYWYPIEPGDSCWKISENLGVKLENLKEWNENLSCDDLRVGQKICVENLENRSRHLELSQDPERGPLPMFENEKDECGEFAIVKDADTCLSISKQYAANLTKLEQEYNCDLIVPGDTICISENQTCQFRYQIKDETDTCSKISQIFKTTNFEIEEYNSDINCTSESLEIGRRICVWPIEERELANVTCIEYQKRDGSSLFQLARQNSISIDELMFLNPNFDQEDNICIKSNSTVKCAGFEFIQSNDTCDIIIQRNQMSMKLLMTLNPTLRCDSLNITKEVCIGTGYFEANECVNTIRVGPHNDRCHKISNSTSISIERMRHLNKDIICSESAQLEWSSLVCVSSLGMKTEDAHETVVEQLGDLDPNLQRRYQEYLDNPNDETSQNMNQQIMESVGNETVHQKLKELYKTDDNIRTILDSHAPLSRDVYCEQGRQSTLSDRIKNCYCTPDELVIYCQSIAQKEYISTMDPPTNNPSSFSRRKRCIVNWPGRGTKIFDKDACFGAECAIEMEVVELSFEANMCVPFVKYEKNTLTTCLRGSNDCTSSQDVGEEYLKELSGVSISAAASLCVVGSELLHALRLHGICWKLVEFEYNPFVGHVSVEVQIPLAIVSFKYGIDIKTTDLPYSSMCDMGAFQCEDYCRMKEDNWNNGKSYSQFEVRLLHLLGFRGFKVYGKKFNDPQVLGCEDGSKATIVLQNDRNCSNEAENVIETNCWSGKNKMEWGKLEKLSGFSFKPWRRTLFVCQFKDSNGQVIGFDVYGGKSKHTGKKTFYYAVGNEGIYYGKVKNDENVLLAKWAKPCTPKPGYIPPPTTAPDVVDKKDNQAAVVLRNERNCENEEDNVIRRMCWSGNDKVPWRDMVKESGFVFRPKHNTLFVCRFVDSNGQQIGFDVYGGKSKQKGKDYFYYAVKNDGIYFGKYRDEENVLKARWARPCSVKKVEEQPPAIIEPTGNSSVPAASCGKRIVGYYTAWGDRMLTEDQLKKLTHVIFAFVDIDENQNLKFGKVSVDDWSNTSDSKAESRFLDMTKKARSVNAGVNVLFAIGGWNNSQYFSSICSNSVTRSRLVDNIIKFINTTNIDGVDIDWEYPNGDDKVNHVQFIREIREKLDDLQQKKQRKHKYLITMATAAGEWNLNNGYDFDNLLKYVDFLNIMTYDYYGTSESKWGAYTGPPSPLYYGTLDGFSGKLNADFTMKYYSCKTKKSQQLSMGIPFYGRYWDNVLGAINGTDGMWRTAEEKNGKFEGGFVGWRNLERQGWNKGASIWHDKTKTPYILNAGAKKFLGYENEKSIGEKINYAIDKNVGGLMVWALDLDDDSDTLLSLVSSADLCSAENQSPYNCE